MIFLSNDAFNYIKKIYIKNYVKLFINLTLLYTLLKTISKQEYKICNLTKKVEELNLKGD